MQNLGQAASFFFFFFFTSVTPRVFTWREKTGALIPPWQKVSTSDMSRWAGRNKKIAINERVSGRETDTAAAATSRDRNLSPVRFSSSLLKAGEPALSKSPPCRAAAGYNGGAASTRCKCPFSLHNCKDVTKLEISTPTAECNLRYFPFIFTFHRRLRPLPNT